MSHESDTYDLGYSDAKLLGDERIEELTAERDELTAAASAVVARWQEGRFGGSDSATNRVRFAVGELRTALAKGGE